MNTETVCASPCGETHWSTINWIQCIRNVKRLQMRIVKATQAGRWNKVKALQRLLSSSFSGKALAVKRVTENEGRKTSGVDGQLWSTPKTKSRAVQGLNRHGYKPYPLRRVYIPKSNDKERPLGIPTMKDRAMQALYLLALQPVAETTADLHSYGFRPERATQDAIRQCFTLLSRKRSAQWILEGDIRGCFDNISHEWIIDNIPMDKKILHKWLKAGYIHDRTLYPTEAGTPLIRGWANYHRSNAAKETFIRVDCEIWRTLWRWAKRRHPGKTTGWIKEKYYKTAGFRHWVFAAGCDQQNNAEGKPSVLSLFRASDVSIKRHIQIKGEANPFDPRFDSYFERRLISKIQAKLQDKRSKRA
ncbi:MAG TPA: reverse transcriptase N-terminal domain-containing protein [Dissulfurispiraceae bacterium]|nr:reverse transcriptase N-terminal domain-containing protein [Dissulfurispiraceae bacterium]